MGYTIRHSLVVKHIRDKVLRLCKGIFPHISADGIYDVDECGGARWQVEVMLEAHGMVLWMPRFCVK